jgi:diacylglycerol kinase (ATP)
VGLDAEVARRANQLPRALRRRGGYLFSVLPALFGFRPMAVEVRAHNDSSGGLDIRHDGSVMVVAFANTPTYGGGILIAPQAQLDDGKLDVCVVGTMAKTRLLRLFRSVYSGRHLRIPEVRYFQAGRLRIETKKLSDVYADGEYVCSTPVDVRVERAALNVIVPVPRRK